MLATCLGVQVKSLVLGLGVGFGGVSGLGCGSPGLRLQGLGLRGRLLGLGLPEP